MARQLKKIVLFLVFLGIIENISAQVVLKLGDNLKTINKGTALDVESTTKGFLPPRMTKTQRDAIVSPPAGMTVWCFDCNVNTKPPSGELSIYSGTGWAPLSVVTTPKLSTGKKSDANGPVKLSSTSAKINGVLLSYVGSIPTETGIVWKEILGDFGVFPVLDDNAVASESVYKTVGTLVTTPGSAISVTIPSLTSSTFSIRPYYFRTYAKNSSGVGYGNPVVFNCAPPAISPPVVTYQGAAVSSFSSNLTVNAGTIQNSITEYGYCSGTMLQPTTSDSKVVLSSVTSLSNLNTSLNSETFTQDPKINLLVTDYNKTTTGTTYFRFYAIANGITIYSDVVAFDLVIDPVTGGTAVATITKIDPISTPLKIDVASGSSFTVHFNVTKLGTYASFVPADPTGATTGLAMPLKPADSFTALGSQTLTFNVTGTPATSLEGNSFVVPRIGTLKTGAILLGDFTGGDAICDALHITKVVEIPSKTGKIWMDRNLGASRAAITRDDYQAYGGLYQWGRGNDGHASMKWTGSNAGTAVNGATDVLSKTDTPGDNLFIVVARSPFDWRSPRNNFLWQGIGSVNNPCPSGYRLPTDAEFTQEMNNYATAVFINTFKIAYAGFRDNFSGVASNWATRGFYWTSTTNPNGGAYYRELANEVSGVIQATSMGYSVRCIKD